MLEYGILSGANIRAWFGDLQPLVSSLLDSPLFWPGVCLAVVAGVFAFRLLR
jgi:hypothetical protein